MQLGFQKKLYTTQYLLTSSWILQMKTFLFELLFFIRKNQMKQFTKLLKLQITYKTKEIRTGVTAQLG